MFGSLETAFVLLQFASTWFMIGLIWLIQRVQYPLMQRVSSDEFSTYQSQHQTRIATIVMPAMLCEGASWACLWWFVEDDVLTGLQACGGLLLAIIWISTFYIQVPIHQRLLEIKDTDLLERLVRTNWIRTAAWTIRGGLVAVHVYLLKL